MSQNLFVYVADSVVAILIPVSRAGTGIGGPAAATAPPIPVPARLTGIKIAARNVARHLLNKRILFLPLSLFFSMLPTYGARERRRAFWVKNLVIKMQ